MNIIKAVVIYTDKTFASEDYGLYVSNITSLSEFRFAERQLFGVSDFDHNYNFVTKNGIPDIIKTLDLRQSGNTVQSNDVTLRLKNTTQFDKFLSSNNISLLGNNIAFFTFVGTDSDSDSTGIFLDAIRTIEEISYTETEIILKVKMSLSKQRNKRLSSVLDIANYHYVPDSNKDKIIPIMFGSSDPVNGRYFKILQSIFQNDILKVIDTIIYDDAKTYNPYSYKFPVIQDSTNSRGAVFLLSYAIDSDDIALDVNTNNPDWFVGMFIFCVSGSSGNTNVSREIELLTLVGYAMPQTDLKAIIAFRDYMQDLPKGNATFDATDQAYFEIHDIDIRYVISHYDILGFFDSVTGLSQSINYDLYGDIGDKVIEKLMSSSIEYSSANKEIDLNPRIFNKSDLTTLLNYDCYPASRIDKMEREDFDAVGHTGYDVTLDTDPLVVIDGLNCTSYALATMNNNAGTTGSYFNATDRQSGSGHRWINVFGGIYAGPALNTIEVGYKIAFPILPENYKFTKCYLGLNLKTTPSSSSYSMNAESSCKVFLQKKQTIHTDGASGIDVLNIDNIPDFYYLINPETKNYNFFYNASDTTSGQLNIRGYKNFEIDATTLKDIMNIGWVGIIVEVNMANPHFSIESIFEEACFIFEREQDISGEMFV